VNYLPIFEDEHHDLPVAELAETPEQLQQPTLVH